MTQHSDGGPADVLWAINIYGPDDMIAAPDYLSALHLANAFNEWWTDLKTNEPLHEYDPRMWAVPIEWNGGPEGHAAALENRHGEYEWLRDAVAAREVQP